MNVCEAESIPGVPSHRTKDRWGGRGRGGGVLLADSPTGLARELSRVWLHLKSWLGPPQAPHYNDLLRSSITAGSPDEKAGRGKWGPLEILNVTQTQKIPIQTMVCVTGVDHLNLMASSHLWYLISFFTSAKRGGALCMVNIWHILDYSYVVFCCRQDRLSHPKASCNICSVPFLIPNQLLKSNWHLISDIIGLHICTKMWWCFAARNWLWACCNHEK